MSTERNTTDSWTTAAPKQTIPDGFGEMVTTQLADVWRASRLAELKAEVGEIKQAIQDGALEITAAQLDEAQKIGRLAELQAEATGLISSDVNNVLGGAPVAELPEVATSTLDWLAAALLERDRLVRDFLARVAG